MDSSDLFSSLGAVGDLVWRHSEVREDLSDPSGVHATVWSYVTLTASVYIYLTN